MVGTLFEPRSEPSQPFANRYLGSLLQMRVSSITHLHGQILRIAPRMGHEASYLVRNRCLYRYPQL